MTDNPKWNYDPDRCEDRWCTGNCWWCNATPDHDGEVDDPTEWDEL